MQKIKNIYFYLLLFVCLFSCTTQNQISKLAGKSLLNNPKLATATIGIAVYQEDGNKFIYKHNSDKLFRPASNTKIATCYAALKYLGDSLEGIKYQIENDSTLLIEPTGDPTLLHPDFAKQPVYDFLKGYKSIQIINPAFTENYLGNGWSWDDYQYPDAAQRSNLPVFGNLVWVKLINKKLNVIPRGFNYSIQENAIFDSGFDFERSFDENKILFKNGDNKNLKIPFVPFTKDIVKMLEDTLHNQINIGQDSTVHLYKTIYSQHTDSVLKIMMHRSDNFFAEQMLLMVSNKILRQMSDEKIIDSLLNYDYKNFPQPPQWVDGSGLSNYNLFSPQDFVFILTKMKNEFNWSRITTIFPTADEGTLHGLYTKLNGKIFAKTGTISNCIALSGYLITHKNKTYIFSVLVNNHNTGAREVRLAIESFIEQLAAKY